MDGWGLDYWWRERQVVDFWTRGTWGFGLVLVLFVVVGLCSVCKRAGWRLFCGDT